MKLSNLCLYRLIEPIGLSPEALAEALADHTWQPCGQFDAETLGWHLPAAGIHDELVHAAEGRVLLNARRETKLLPASVLRDHMRYAISDFEDQHGRKMGKNERETLRERVTLELLPRAFTRHADISVLIDDRRGWLLVDSASVVRAEAVTGLLRDALGSLRIRPPEPTSDPVEHMTRWLARPGGLPRHFALGDECELTDPDAGAVARLRRHTLTGSEVDSHLNAGKRVTRLGLDWREQASFVLGDDLIVRKLKFADTLNEDERDDDEAARFDADFALFSHTALAVCDDVLAALGGEATPSSTSANARSGAAQRTATEEPA
ncbi:MAG: recombination-associated protein RdgC [Pseudomonadota bacterium]